jgi:hypothetical protein
LQDEDVRSTENLVGGGSMNDRGLTSLSWQAIPGIGAEGCVLDGSTRVSDLISGHAHELSLSWERRMPLLLALQAFCRECFAA